MGENYVNIGSRGTSRRIDKKERENSTGPAFRNNSEKQKEQSKNRYITVGRGTGKIKFEDIHTTSKVSSGKGMWVSSGRGTGKRLIK